MAFPNLDESRDKAVDKAFAKRPAKSPEGDGDVTLDELFAVATPEERQVIEACLERIDAQEAPPAP